MTDERKAYFEERLAYYERKRDALVDLSTEAGVQSATVSSQGGSSSFTNRSTSDVKAQIVLAEREIARCLHALGRGSSPSKITPVIPITII